MTVPFRLWIPVALVAATALGVSCASATAAPVFPSPSVSPAGPITDTPEPAIRIRGLVEPLESPVPTALSTATARIAAPLSSTEQPRAKSNLDAIAPPGAARDLILQNCGTCHSFVCAFRGQRTIEHWQTIKQDMRGKVSQLDDQEYNEMFAYLEANFNDQKPEPELPPELQQLGCSSGVR